MSHSFAALTRKISRSTLEINLVFTRTHVLFSIFQYPPGGVCIYVRANLIFKIRNDLQSEILENLIVEIIKPQSKSILVSTWYRPPDSPVSYFTEFEKMVGLLDTENLEYFVLGDLNVDFKQLAKSSCRDKLDEFFYIYGIHQLINESTRITETSSSLIDLCLTNSIT